MDFEAAVDAEPDVKWDGRGGRVGVGGQGRGSRRGSRLGSGMHAPSLEICTNLYCPDFGSKRDKEAGESSLAAGQGRREQGSECFHARSD